MGVKIVHEAKAHSYELSHIIIDMSRKTGVLMRQSRKKADHDNFESRLRQESLVQVAIELRGDEDDSNIEVYDEGAGVSGTKGYDQRPKLSKLYIGIANNVIGSIIVARADRLFRDKHFRNVSMFTEIAEKKGILVIVPGRTVYDFTKTKDLQAFQQDMQEAYRYISTQIEYMTETRQQKMKRGGYGGTRLTLPYVISKAAWKEEQIPLIYEPWRQNAIDLCKKFIEYDFSLARISEYVASLPCLFPYMLPEDAEKYFVSTNMARTEKGYTISAFGALKYYLSNLTLGGYAKIGKDEQGNVLLKENAFEAAIPMEILEPCYAAITGFYLDGRPFGEWKNSRRSRKSTGEFDAILHGFLVSNDGLVSVARNNNGNLIYACNKPKTHVLKQETAWSVPCLDLDSIIISRLGDLVQHDLGIADRVKAIWQSRQSTEVGELEVLQGQIDKAQAQIKHYDKLLTNPAKPLSTETEGRYIDLLSQAELDLHRYLRRRAVLQQVTEDPEKVIPNFYYVLSHLPTEYKKLSPENQKMMIRKVALTAQLHKVSTHAFALQIEWENGIAVRPDVALIWRSMAPNTNAPWTPEQDALLAEMYTDQPQIELMREFPHRSWSGIYDRAIELYLHREYQEVHYHRTMRFEDLEAVSQFVEGEKAKERICEKANSLAKQTKRGHLSGYWWLPLTQISYVSLGEPDEFNDGAIVDRWSQLSATQS